MRDYYQVLGIPASATPEQIKTRYRFLSHAYHPDKFSSAEHKAHGEAEFKLINEAYQTLSDPQRRRAYDSTRAQSATRQQQPRPQQTSTTSPPPAEKSRTISSSMARLLGFVGVILVSSLIGIIRDRSNSTASRHSPDSRPSQESKTFTAWVRPDFPVTLRDDSTWTPSPTIFRKRQPTDEPGFDLILDTLDPLIASLIKSDYSRTVSGQAAVGRQVLLERDGTWRYVTEADK